MFITKIGGIYGQREILFRAFPCFHKNGIKTATTENGRLPILLNGQPIGRVEPSGMMCLTLGEIQTLQANDLYHWAVPIADMVKKYMNAMEQAPILHANGLESEYRLLADFGGKVLAGTEIVNSYGHNFVTWNWDYDKTGVSLGHYFMDNYAAAKEDFSVRAGLVSENRMLAISRLLKCIDALVIHWITSMSFPMIRQSLSNVPKAN